LSTQNVLLTGMRYPNFAILLDDNNRKTICRLYLGTKKYLVVLDDAKKEVKHEIAVIDGIYDFAHILVESIKKLEKK